MISEELLNEDAVKFYAALYQIKLKSRNNESDLEEFIQTLIELHNSKRVDLCLRAIEAVQQEINVFQITNIIEDVIPQLDLQKDTFIKLLETLFNGNKSTSNNYILYTAVEKLVENQNDFSREVLDALLDCDQPFVFGYISEFFHFLSKPDANAIHKELIHLKEHSSIFVIKAVVIALSNINYEHLDAEHSLIETFDTYEYIKKRNLPEIDYWIVTAYGNLLNTSELASNKLIEYSDNYSTEVDYALSNVLQRSIDGYCEELWFETVLMQLARTKYTDIRTIENIDFVLSQLIRKDKSDLAEKFFISWVITSNYKKVEFEERLDKLFDSTFVAFVSHKTKFQKILTRLFNHDSSHVHWAASELVSYCMIHGIKTLSFDKEELSMLEYQDIKYIGRKVLGYLIHCEMICSLTFSLLDASIRNKKIQALVYTIFNDHIAHDYTASSIAFLKEVVANTKSKIKKQLATQLISNSEQFLEALNSLPRIKEIIPPSQESRIVMKEQAKIMARSIDEAQKDLIFRQICTTLILKQGKGSFTYHNGDYTTPSQLSSISHEMEIPISERNYPVSAFIQSVGFRNAKRGD